MTTEQNILPRNNDFLLGHENEEAFFMNAFKTGTLHNSWIITGIEGIGKATFAYKVARQVMNDTNNLIAKNAHPDFKSIERDYTDTDKRKIIKAIKDGNAMDEDELSNLKKSANIKVDEVRTINEFLSKRSSNDGWRVVLIDSIDEMNQNGANAVLKILEEPPVKTLMLLISHNPNKLLPTIKSRCAKINLKPLSDNNLASLIRRYRPETSEPDIKAITKISGGSIGKAISCLDNNAHNKYEDLQKIIYAKEKFNISDLLSFVDSTDYELAKELTLKFITDNIKESTNVPDLSDAWDKAIKTFNETERLNMDKRQTLINIINNLTKVI